MFKKKPSQPPKYNIHRTLSSGVDRTRPAAKNLDGKAQKTKKQWFKRKRTYLLLFLILITPLIVIGIWDLRNFSAASSKLFGSGNPIGVLATKPLDDKNDRVNILLIGYSADDPDHGGALLTDSIMILSLDKDKKTGYTLSIPRDLYVDIPGYKKAKINEAYQAGERNSSSDGGVSLLRKVISENFGIETHYYFLIDYAAVRDTVDALGGVNVTIDSPDKRGIYDPNFQPDEGGPLKLSNGSHKLDGQTALRLTRARGSTFGSYGFPQSDFNRTQNQQAVLNAIKSQLNWTIILDPRTNGKIFDAAAENLVTDLELSELLPLYRLVNAVPSDKLKPAALNNLKGVNLLTGYRTPSGQAAIIPAAGISDFSQIKKAIIKLNF